MWCARPAPTSMSRPTAQDLRAGNMNSCSDMEGGRIDMIMLGVFIFSEQSEAKEPKNKFATWRLLFQYTYTCTMLIPFFISVRINHSR